MRNTLVLFLTLGFALAAAAERVPQSLEQMQKDATHIVVGKVTNLFKTDRTTNALGKGTVEDFYAVELAIEKVEKNPTLQGGEVNWEEKARQHMPKEGLVYVRCFSVKKAPLIPLPGPGGHKPLPSVGDRVRAYVIRGQDGGYDVIYPNGFELLKKE